MELQDSEREIFISEIAEKITQLNDALIRFEKDPQNKDIINLLFRVAHTIKGNASFVDLMPMINLGHALEDGFAVLREGAITPGAETIGLFFQACDVISQMLEQYRTRQDIPEQDYSALAERIRASLETQPATTEKATTTEPRQRSEKTRVVLSPGEFAYQIEIKLQDRAPMPGMRAYLIRKKLTGIATILREKPEVGAYEHKNFSGLFGFIVRTSKAAPELRKALLSAETEHLVVKRLASAAAPAPVSTTAPTPIAPQAVKDNVPTGTGGETDANELLRVPSRKIDDLVNLVGELLSNNSVYLQLNTDFRRSFGNHPLFAQYRDNAEEMARIIADLQEKVLKVRMVPVNTIFSRFARVVRDYNAKHPDKRVQLVISGADTEIDKGQIEKMYEPLLHMVRNSIDHGIESSGVRQSLSKAAEGHVYLAATQEGNNIYIEIRDDGAGLDEEKIREKAIEKGLIRRDEVASLTSADIFNFIFLPGFSTAAAVTDISGRGVGMDVVKRSIEDLHGRITVESEKGRGTTFRIALPLSLAIVTALRIRVRRSSMAIPITSIVETIRIKKSEILKLENIEAVDVRGKHVPVYSLAQELGVKGPSEYGEQMEHVVIVQVRQGRIGLRVDELFGYEDMVIKSLSRNFENVDGISGAAILGRGNICLILDPQKLVDVVYRRDSGTDLFGKPRLRIRSDVHTGTGVELLEKILEAGHENALSAIRQMTNDSGIQLEYREIRLRPWNAITTELEERQSRGVKFFYTRFESGVEGIQFITIEPAHMQTLAALFFSTGASALTADDIRSAITELTNIICVSLTNAITIHAGLRVFPTVPTEAKSVAELAQYLSSTADTGQADALTMDVDFQTKDKVTLFNYTIVLAREMVRAFGNVEPEG